MTIEGIITAWLIGLIVLVVVSISAAAWGLIR